MDKYQVRDLIWQYLSEKIDSYECWNHVKGFDKVVREYRKTVLGDAVIPQMELYESDSHDFFILGEVVGGRFNGLGCTYNIKSKKLYMGQFLDNKGTGEGLYICANHTYYGGFINDNYSGEGEIMTPTLYVRARFENGDIIEVYNNSSAFDWNGKHYDENGKLEKGSSCLGWISIAFMILLAMGIYSYCSAWWKNYSDSEQTEINEITTTYICTAKKSLKVRTAPNTSASQIGSIISGEEVEVYEVSDGFAKVSYNGDIGYASVKYLKRK